MQLRYFITDGGKPVNLFQGIEERNIPNYFSWLNKPNEWKFINGRLEIIAPTASDFFIDEEGPSIRNSAPFFYTNVKGDFDLTTRVDVEMLEMFDSGCLMLMSDSDNWAKLCYENWFGEPSIVSVVTKTMSDDCVSLKLGNVKPYLKILRSRNCFGFHYSLNNVDWTIIRYFNMNVPEEIKVGVVAQCPVGKGCKVGFEFLEMDSRKIKSAKVVERRLSQSDKQG